MRIAEFIEHLQPSAVLGEQDSLAQAVLKASPEVLLSPPSKSRPVRCHAERLVVRPTVNPARLSLGRSA